LACAEVLIKARAAATRSVRKGSLHPKNRGISETAMPDRRAHVSDWDHRGKKLP